MDLVLSQLNLSLRAYSYLLGQTVQLTYQKGLYTLSICLLLLSKGLLVALAAWTLNRFHFKYLSGYYVKQRMLYTFTLNKL